MRYRNMQQTSLASSAVPTNNTAVTQGPSISISNFAFSPANMTVSAGSIITVTNNDTVAHTMVSDDGTSFSTTSIDPGTSTTITAPTTPGTYAYHCSIHPMMKGTIIVQ